MSEPLNEERLAELEWYIGLPVKPYVSAAQWADVESLLIEVRRLRAELAEARKEMRTRCIQTVQDLRAAYQNQMIPTSFADRQVQVCDEVIHRLRALDEKAPNRP